MPLASILQRDKNDALFSTKLWNFIVLLALSKTKLKHCRTQSLYASSCSYNKKNFQNFDLRANRIHSEPNLELIWNYE